MMRSAGRQGGNAISPASEKALDEALVWLIQVSDMPEDTDLRTRFDVWHDASMVHAEAWRQVRRTYDLIGRTEPRHAAQWAPHADRRRASVERRDAVPGARSARREGLRPGRRWRMLPWGAVGVAACLLLLVFGPTLLVGVRADYVTGTAEVREVTLGDGSHVTLAPDSALRAFVEGKQRGATLLKGGAFFSVARESSRPFRVKAGEAVVTVLGTAFDVRLNSEGTDVAVRDGHVRVAGEDGASTETAELLAGDRVSLGADGRLTRGRKAPGEVAEWRLGRLVVRDRPIGEVVEALRPYFAGAIVLADATFSERRVNGIMRLDTPEETLRNLADAYGATVRRMSPWLLVVTAR